MKKIKYLVIHYSASSFGDVKEIRKWHLKRGWRDIGYNLVILNGFRKYRNDYNKNEDGLIEVGRGLNFDNIIDPDERGAHTLNYNSKSIGICYVGTKKPSERQLQSLSYICRLWKRIIPDIKIVGHNEFKKTSCPGFNVQHWLKKAQI